MIPESILLDLKHIDISKKRSALSRLHEIGTMEAIVHIMKATRDFDAGVRYLAKKILQDLRKKFIKDNLDANKIFYNATINLIKEDINSNDVDIRLNAIKKIREYKDKIFSTDLLNRLKTEKNPYCLSAIIKTLPQLEQNFDVSIIEPFLNHEDARVVANAIEAINLVGTKEKLKELKPYLYHKNYRIATSAALALYPFFPDEVYATLTELINSPDEAKNLSAIYVLSQIKNSKSKELLLKLQQKSNLSVRLKASIARSSLEQVSHKLAETESEDEELISKQLTKLTSKNKNKRLSAIRVLQNIDTGTEVAAISKIVKIEKDKEVKRELLYYLLKAGLTDKVFSDLLADKENLIAGLKFLLHSSDISVLNYLLSPEVFDILKTPEEYTLLFTTAISISPDILAKIIRTNYKALKYIQNIKVPSLLEEEKIKLKFLRFLNIVKISENQELKNWSTKILNEYFEPEKVKSEQTIESRKYSFESMTLSQILKSFQKTELPQDALKQALNTIERKLNSDNLNLLLDYLKTTNSPTFICKCLKTLNKKNFHKPLETLLSKFSTHENVSIRESVLNICMGKNKNIYRNIIKTFLFDVEKHLRIKAFEYFYKNDKTFYYNTIISNLYSDEETINFAIIDALSINNTYRARALLSKIMSATINENVEIYAAKIYKTVSNNIKAKARELMQKPLNTFLDNIDKEDLRENVELILKVLIKRYEKGEDTRAIIKKILKQDIVITESLSKSVKALLAQKKDNKLQQKSEKERLTPSEKTAFKREPVEVSSTIKKTYTPEPEPLPEMEGVSKTETSKTFHKIDESIYREFYKKIQQLDADVENIKKTRKIRKFRIPDISFLLKKDILITTAIAMFVLGFITELFS